MDLMIMQQSFVLKLNRKNLLYLLKLSYANNYEMKMQHFYSFIYFFIS